MLAALRPLPDLDDPGPLVADWLDARGGAIAAARPTLLPLLGGAPYLFELAQRHHGFLEDALERDPDESFGDILARVAALGAMSDETGAGAALRRGKGELALLAGIAECGGVWTTARATEALALYADAALDAGLDVLMREAARKGRLALAPERAGAGNTGLAIFALGKHGGCELNYSSDIDVVAFYDPDAGVLADPAEANSFYTRIVRALAALMQDRTADGYVFRTDLRLRPDPGSTPVAISVDAALTYYEARGQNWERAAWIKARVAAGDRRVGEAFLRDMAPFVWRKHLDFATIADIQAMKRQINVARKVGEARVAGHNVKLGPGGIREIEFFAQTQQLIAGGRDPALRVRPTVLALDALGTRGWITLVAATELSCAYWFLRAVENRLQMLRDEQTHTMPEDAGELAVLARLMGDADTAGFERRYRAALGVVSAYYAELFSAEESLAAVGGNLVFTGADDDPATLETLSNLGFAEPGTASATIRKWHYGGYAATRAAAARAHLTELLPALLATIAGAGNADLALGRFDHFLSRLPAGVQLFAMLRTHETLLRTLVAFMASAPRMAEAVIHRAHVMDAIIDPAFADDVARTAAMVEKVDDFLADARGYEDLIDRARIIGQEQRFLVATGLISGTIDAGKAGRQYTALADTLVGRMLGAVRTEFAHRHGTVPGAEAALLAFGKMASGEMTMLSDLDVILLYDAPGGADASDGERPLETPHYFARLTQRLVAALSAPTAEGVLYEVDMRLRPSGNAGPLATSLRAFSNYQRENAWTWEHLALTRARVVAGDGGLGRRIEAAIAQVLDAPRDREKTVADVRDMRSRLARDRPPRHRFDLKLQPGGLIDLEFLAQSAQLLHPEAIGDRHAGVAEVLARLGAAGLLPEGERLARIHATYSTVLQVMSACLLDPFRDDGWTDAFRELLARLTNYPDFSRLEADLPEMAGEVTAAAEGWYAREQG